jgi:N4-gp56 family major capsid protein
MSGQLWGTNTLGGFMYADELSDVMRTEVRAAAKFRPLCDAQDFSDKGLNNGQLVTWNVYSKLQQSGTTLTEGTAIPQSNFLVKQGTATITEWGIAVPFTSLVDLYSRQSVTAVTRNILARDAREALDRGAHGQFNNCLLRYVGTGTAVAGVLTTNGTATATNASPLNKYHWRAIVNTMKERNIPGFASDDYVAIARPTTWEPIRSELEGVFQYTESGYGKILKGEIGRYDSCRAIEQTNILKGVNNTGTAWSSAASDWAYFMGADTAAEIIAVPPEIRGKIPGDYGRDLGVAWYALEGFGIMYSSTNDSGATNSRIIKWDSAA